jgi:hypothetical protein
MGWSIGASQISTHSIGAAQAPAAAGANAPTGHLAGPLYGPFVGPIFSFFGLLLQLILKVL